MMEVRRAVESDSREIWAWRNDPATRAASLTGDPIAWEDHAVWYSAALESDRRAIYIGELPGAGSAGIGMCRFDLDPDSGLAEVSINLNPKFRGQGLSKDFLDLAITRFRGEFEGTERLIAVIQRSNSASKRLFSSSGFELSSADGSVDTYVLTLGDSA